MAKMIEIVEKARHNSGAYVNAFGSNACAYAHEIAKKYVTDKMQCRGIGAEIKRQELETWFKNAVNGWAEKFGRNPLDFISLTGMDYRTGAPYKEKNYGAFHRVNMHAYKAC